MAMQSTQSIIAGFDIGSNQITCAVGSKDEKSNVIRVLGAAIVPASEGIKAGAIINMREASAAVAKAFEESGRFAPDGEINCMVTAVRGNFIKTSDAKGTAYPGGDGKVSEEDVENALTSARRQIKLSQGDEIIQTITKEFKLNGKQSVQDPLGMKGSSIEVSVHALIASNDNLGNIKDAIEQASGEECDNIVYSYLAASEILLTKEDKEQGCLVVDFGGLTTALIHYYNGVIKHSGEIILKNEASVGSDHITKDIMSKFKTSYAIAKKLKEEYGMAYKPNGFKDEEVEYETADGRKKKLKRSELIDLIDARIAQLFYFIEEEMKRVKFTTENLTGGIILTGGGSNLAGLVEAFEEHFRGAGLVRVGVPLPEKAIGPDNIIRNPAYSAAIGAMTDVLSTEFFERGKKSSGMFGKLKELWGKI